MKLLHVVATTVTALALVGCGGDEPVEVRYLADSSLGAPVEVTYDGSDGEVTEVVDVPWELVVEHSGSYSASLEVRNTELEGEVACGVGGEDFPPIETGGEAAATCRVSVQRSGGGRSVSTSTDFELFVRDADGNAVPPPPEPIRLRGADLGRAVPAGSDLLLGSHTTLFVLDVEDGSVEEYRQFSKPTDPARTEDGTLVASSYFDGTVEVLTPGAEDVEIIAEYPDERPAAVWAVDGELLVSLGEPDDLVRIGLDGTERWRVSMPGEVLDVVEVDGLTLAVTDERDTGAILVLDPATGSIDGTVVIDVGPVALSTDGTSLFVRHRDEIVSQIAVAELAAGEVDPFVRRGDRFVVGLDDAVYRQTGAVVHRLDPVSGETLSTIDVGDLRLIAASGATLYLIERGSGGDPSIVALPVELFG